MLLGNAECGPSLKNGELFENYIEKDGIKVGALAEVEVNGNRVILKDVSIYSNKGDVPNQVGVSEMKAWINSTKMLAKEQGFTELQIIGQRAEHSTSANPGNIINRIFKLD